MDVLGHFGGHFGSLGAPFGLILALLGHLLASFGRSWGVLGRLFGPSWPKMAKKVDFCSLSSGSWHKLGPQNREKSVSKTTCFSNVFSALIFLDFSSNLGSKNGRFLGRFLDLKRKRRFCEN